jgi:hypothetical protein
MVMKTSSDRTADTALPYTRRRPVYRSRCETEPLPEPNLTPRDDRCSTQAVVCRMLSETPAHALARTSAHSRIHKADLDGGIPVSRGRPRSRRAAPVGGLPVGFRVPSRSPVRPVITGLNRNPLGLFMRKSLADAGVSVPLYPLPRPASAGRLSSCSRRVSGDGGQWPAGRVRLAATRAAPRSARWPRHRLA